MLCFLDDFVCVFNKKYAELLRRLTSDEYTTRKHRDRNLELIHQPIESLIISKTSEVGETILSLWKQYDGFSTKYLDEVAPDSEAPF